MMLRNLVIGAALAGAAAFSLSASAGALDGLKSALPGAGGSSGVAGALGGGGMLGALGDSGFQLGSPQNVIGVLSFCQQHGYAPSATDMVKDKLMGKFGLGQETEQSTEYQQGAAGILKDAQGGTLNLGALQDVVGKKACGMVADKATSSLLGGM